MRSSTLNERLASTLASLPVVEWEGEVWRHTFGDNPPDKPNARGARWNPAGVEAIYTSLERSVALAEADYQIAAQPLRPRAKRTLHRMRVQLGAVLILTDAAVLLTLGIDEAAIAGSSYETCQAVGLAAVSLQCDAIIVPSARSPGHNLVILLDQVGNDFRLELLESEVVQVDSRADPRP